MRMTEAGMTPHGSSQCHLSSSPCKQVNYYILYYMVKYRCLYQNTTDQLESSVQTGTSRGQYRFPIRSHFQICHFASITDKFKGYSKHLFNQSFKAHADLYYINSYAIGLQSAMMCSDLALVDSESQLLARYPLFLDEECPLSDIVSISSSTFFAGFGLLEAGAVKLKNEVNIMIKNAADVVMEDCHTGRLVTPSVSVTVLGSNPFCGIGMWFVSTDNVSKMGPLYASFIFQLPLLQLLLPLYPEQWPKDANWMGLRTNKVIL